MIGGSVGGELQRQRFPVCFLQDAPFESPHAGFDHTRRIAGDDGIRFHILRHHRPCRDDGAVTDMEPWHDDGVRANEAIAGRIGVRGQGRDMSWVSMTAPKATSVPSPIWMPRGLVRSRFALSEICVSGWISIPR